MSLLISIKYRSIQENMVQSTLLVFCYLMAEMPFGSPRANVYFLSNICDNKKYFIFIDQIVGVSWRLPSIPLGVLPLPSCTLDDDFRENG